jgi:hypothetical protein
VREGDFRHALAEIRELEAIHSIPSLLRVLWIVMGFECASFKLNY